MSGERQQRQRPIAVRFYGMQPGQTPYVELDYEDGRDTVQRLLDDPETQPLLIDAVGGGEYAS